MIQTDIDTNFLGPNSTLRIAVLIPCYNEAATIKQVIEDFSAVLPNAKIYVYDNNSRDGTSEIAEAAGAIVRTESRQGKGFVVRRMFSDIEADAYILVDGDSTYDATAAPALIAQMLIGPFDKVNAIRVHRAKAAYRPGHVVGNRIMTSAVAWIFGSRSRDMLSGYKVLSRRFVKSFPSVSSGFEIETEILVHALELNVPMSEIETEYRERPEGSVSKLSTIKDGFRILGLIMHLIRDFMPLYFFGTAAVLLCLVSITLGGRVLIEFLETGLVPRLPTALLSLGVMIVAVLSLFAGLILDSVARGRREIKLLHYLSFPSVIKE
jgi:glycosyltransferase involved in cell wall biosynthesis